MCLFVQLIFWAIVARKVQRVLQEQLALPHCLEEQSQEDGTKSKSHGRKFLLPSIERETFFATAESFPKVFWYFRSHHPCTPYRLSIACQRRNTQGTDNPLRKAVCEIRSREFPGIYGPSTPGSCLLRKRAVSPEIDLTLQFFLFVKGRELFSYDYDSFAPFFAADISFNKIFWTFQQCRFSLFLLSLFPFSCRIGLFIFLVARLLLCGIPTSERRAEQRRLRIGRISLTSIILFYGETVCNCRRQSLHGPSSLFEDSIRSSFCNFKTRPCLPVSFAS